VGCAHPGLDRAEGMLNRLGIWHSFLNSHHVASNRARPTSP
jgi:hypothetical protein